MLWQVAWSCVCLSRRRKEREIAATLMPSRGVRQVPEQPALSISLCFLHGKLVKWVWGLHGLSKPWDNWIQIPTAVKVLTSAVLKTHLVSPSDPQVWTGYSALWSQGWVRSASPATCRVSGTCGDFWLPDCGCKVWLMQTVSPSWLERSDKEKYFFN